MADGPSAARDRVSASRVRGRWLKIIAAILVSRTDVEAAAHAGISVRTIYRLKKNPEFMVDLQAAKDAQFEHSIDCLRGNALLFTETLKHIAEDEKQPGNARVRASEVGLNVLLKATEISDILRRIAALEQVAGGQK